MIGLPLSFASPLILLGLLALPVIWWLLRLTPPKPKEEVFPPTRILQEVAKQEETPAHSPWWLTLLRLLMAALIILALAEPIWNKRDNFLVGNEPVLIVLDDSWSSGRDWAARKSTAERLLSEAQELGKPVAFALTSEAENASLSPTLALEHEARVAAAKPRPVEINMNPLAVKLQSLPSSFETLVWLSSGLEQKGVSEFLDAVRSSGVEKILHYVSDTTDLAVLTKVTNSPDALVVEAQRSYKTGEFPVTATAFDAKGRSISSNTALFKADESATQIKFELPVELRNEIARISIDGATQAGATQLLDERFRRRRVGLISGGNADQAQPLLSPLYYISRALNPFSEVRESRSSIISESVSELVDEKISTLVLADIGTLPDETRNTLETWVENGGMLIRFAGPRLAGATDDSLVPVELRRGGRNLGGTLTWGTPQPLTSFQKDSPFDGITVPNDVSVTRQVLAEPDIELAKSTWASLADGTPLVTAAQRGDGWIVLFHVTADTSWSNLPLSGSFVDMLRRIVAVSNGAVAADQTRSTASQTPAQSSSAAKSISLPPLRMIDGFGLLTAPESGAQPLIVEGNTPSKPSLENPPGTYGTNDAFVALNLLDESTQLKELDQSLMPANTKRSSYSIDNSAALKPWLLAAAIVLLALDCLAVLWMAGALRRRAVVAASATLVAIMSNLSLQDAAAQDTNFNFENTLRTRLAYVKTGDATLDALSRKGLIGLSDFIGSRTSLEPGEPVGVDINSDELAFYPLIYWPISASVAVPNEKAMARIDAFMKKGGSVLFDTRDQLNGGFGNGAVSAETQRLRQILSSLDIPPLEPVPDDHVLTRSFYLLNIFPGRYLEGKLWVETSQRDEQNAADRPTRQGDGVSSIMITSNDFAGAWAVEANGSPSLPIVPPNPRQRVYAYRTGVNIVMYTLTGNYKSDQVHIPALLERLGQ